MDYGIGRKNFQRMGALVICFLFTFSFTIVSFTIVQQYLLTNVKLTNVFHDKACVKFGAFFNL